MPPVCAGPPALLNRQSMRPNFSTARADQRAHLVFDRDIGLAEDAGGAELVRPAPRLPARGVRR